LLEPGRGVLERPAMQNPFRCSNSPPEVIRLVVVMYVRFPLSLRQFGYRIKHHDVRNWSDLGTLDATHTSEVR